MKKNVYQEKKKEHHKFLFIKLSHESQLFDSNYFFLFFLFFQILLLFQCIFIFSLSKFDFFPFVFFFFF